VIARSLEAINAKFREREFHACRHPPKFNNCAICHEPATGLPKFALRVPASQQQLTPAAADNFAPKAQFFKTMPAGHASCFECHYQGVKPAASNCAGCHQLTTPYTPTGTLKRYSLKFDHAGAEKTISSTQRLHDVPRPVSGNDLKTLTDADVRSWHARRAITRPTEGVDNRADTVEKKQPAFNCVLPYFCRRAFAVPPSHEKP
jgi:hypothetical protein